MKVQFVHELEKEARRLLMEKDVLKSHGLHCQGKFMRYRFIDAHKKVWPVTLMCGVLTVSRSGYYHWASRGPVPCSFLNQMVVDACFVLILYSMSPFSVEKQEMSQRESANLA